MRKMRSTLQQICETLAQISRLYLCGLPALREGIEKMKNFRICYMGTGGFQMYLNDPRKAYFAHHAKDGLKFESKEEAYQHIESLRGKYTEKDLGTLYVIELKAEE